MGSPANNNCDGSHCVPPATAVRVLPLPGRGNLILCRVCHANEIRWRRDRNKELGRDAQYPLPAWEALEVYDGG